MQNGLEYRVSLAFKPKFLYDRLSLFFFISVGGGIVYQALRPYARELFYGDTQRVLIDSLEIKSKEDARKLEPFANPDNPTQRVVFVSPSQRGKDQWNRSHFRIIERKIQSIPTLAKTDELERRKWLNESAEHQLAKALLRQDLQSKIEHEIPLTWHYKDPRVSSFPFSGDLLRQAATVETEYVVHTPHGNEYRLDLAVLSKPVGKYGRRIVLAGIEIEKAHSFDFRKRMLCQSLGFPLISVDITELSLEKLTPAWAQEVLSKVNTRLGSGDLVDRRSTYVYLHDMLFPLFVQLPESFFVSEKYNKHQFIFFTESVKLGQLIGRCEAIGGVHGFHSRAHGTKQIIACSKIVGSTPSAMTQVQNAGAIVGNDWSNYNASIFGRITLLRSQQSDKPDTLYLLHLHLTQELLSHSDLLVGYLYRNQLSNDEPDNPLWIHRKYNPNSNEPIETVILPKRLLSPLG